jgi:6-phosphogluconolactonase (cycloisomerase 2 family)
MKSFLKQWLVLSLVGVALGLSAREAQSQQYIYTNDNVSGGANSASALTVNSKGAVKLIKTYATGGNGAGNGYFALTPIASAKTRLGNCLFVSNGGESTIAAFQVNLFNGTVAAVHGSPFADGVTGAQQFGVGLAVGNNHLLFAGNTNNNSISILRINPNCSLKYMTKKSVPGSPSGMKVTPDGKYLITAYIGQVDSFSINYTSGALSELGPFSPQGSAAGVEISCDSSTVYFGDVANNTQVEAFSISSAGELKEINNFKNSNGQSSNNVMLSVDGKHLYVSNTMSNQITTLSVGSGGALTWDSTVKLRKPGLFALGLATGTSGADIFVSEQANPEAIGVLAASDGNLTEVTGSPFPVVNNRSLPAGLTAIPPKACH